jgi:hypothetical protein
MATDVNGPAPDASAPKGAPKIQMTESGWEGLKIFHKEIRTYLRELPRLLEERQLGKTVLVRGDEIHSIWETQGDAIQAGRILFGLDPIFVKTIDHRDIERYRLLLDYYEAHACQSS